MKKTLAMIILLPGLLFAQYYGERSTEESFETSELYFTSHYLNTFALQNFKKAAAGLMKDPFMNLYINPANLPARDSSALIYMDFRGDRNIAPIVDRYGVAPMYITDLYRPYIDWRWITVARSEPEPVVSAGILTYPLQGVLENLFIGATYQFIYRQEKYYEMPFWIYNSRYLYDSFGAKAMNAPSDMPVVDRQNGSDEMLTKGHLFSAYAGLRLTEHISLGVSVNGVNHKRGGQYSNINNSEYGNTSDNKYTNAFSQDRNEDYNHLDYSAGLSAALSSKFSLGLKAGLLNGKANQDYSKGSNYSYTYKTPGTGDSWSSNYSNSITSQAWEHKGKTKYAGVNFIYSRSEKTELSGYYRYSQSDIDLINSSVIADTMYYSSKWTDNQNQVFFYNGNSGASDIRTGTGSRKYYIHEGMLRFRWLLNRKSSLTLGLYVNNSDRKSLSVEPAAVRRISRYTSVYPPGYPNPNYEYLNRLNEIKTLEWIHEDKSFTFQIPIILKFQVSEAFEIMFAVNRILNNWEITEQTTAYFVSRQRLENGVTKVETNFGERYIQPKQSISETDTDFAAGLNINISPQFQVNLLLDPEFQHGFMLSQWWVGFRAEID